MTKRTENEDLITRYFFGELNEEEKSRIELQVLTDNLFFEEMLSIEEALIDDYVRGQLSKQERKKVEEFLQSSHRHEREINLVERLNGDLAKTRSTDDKEISTTQIERPSKRRPFLILPNVQDSGKQFSLALVALLMIVLGLAVWNIILQRKLSRIEERHAELEKMNQELGQRFDSQVGNNKQLVEQIEKLQRENAQIEQDVTAIKESRPAIPANDTVTLTLAMQSFTRDGGELRTIRISPRTNWLQIRINTGEVDLKSYSARIETFEGNTVWSKDDMKAARTNPDRIIITLPARLFRNEDYTFTLKGQREDGSTVDIGYFPFRIKG